MTSVSTLEALVGARSVLKVGPFSEEMIIGPIFVFIPSFLGLFLVYRGVTNLSRGYSIWSHDPIDAGSVHLEDGTVEVQGEAVPVDGVMSAGYTSTDCLAYKYEKKRKERDYDSDGNDKTRWRTVESGGEKTSFYVRDDTGEVAVDPTGSDLSVNMDLIERTGRTKKYEGRLDPGETVHVYGEKRDAAADGGAPGEETVFICDGEDATFTVSDTTETRTVLRYLAKGLGSLIVGTFVLAFASVPVLIYTEQLEPVVDALSTVLPLVLA